MTTMTILVKQPRRADGVGHALRSAFRGRLEQVPPDIKTLLDRLN